MWKSPAVQKVDFFAANYASPCSEEFIYTINSAGNFYLQNRFNILFFGAVMLQYPHDMFSASQNEYIPESKKKMRQNGETLDLLKKMEDLGIPSMDCVVYSKTTFITDVCIQTGFFQV